MAKKLTAAQEKEFLDGLKNIVLKALNEYCERYYVRGWDVDDLPALFYFLDGHGGAVLQRIVAANALLIKNEININ